MRITILQGAFFPVPPMRGSSVEKLWFELGKQFSRKGHIVCHVSRSFPGLPKHELIEGVRHIRLKGYDTTANGLHLKALDLLYSLRALTALPSADILITNTFWMPILASWRQRRWGKIMVDVQRMPKGQMRLYGRVTCLRANSSAVQKAISREAPHLAGRIRTIPNPLPFDSPALLNPEREQVILYCGRLHPEKGIELLIHAFSLAIEEGLNGWKLSLVGPADTAAGGGGHSWLEDMKNKAMEARLPIEWVGPIYDQKLLLHRYQQSSIFVYPSLAEQGETFGLAPLEAMACGVVPIVSALDCFRDFITPGVNGLVFNHRSSDAAALLATQILELTNNHEQRANMGKAVLAVRQSHHPGAIAADFLSCFEQMIQQGQLS